MGIKTGQLRIIGGKWRSRSIKFADSEGLRPTTNRIRETLFNWLQSDLLNSNCLDLFSGSGALGFEAASRGAKNVVMVEKETQVLRYLKNNADVLAADNIKVIKQDAESLLRAGSERFDGAFDIVFLDPPFNKSLLEHCVRDLEENNWLSPQASIYIECEKFLALDFIPDNWTLHRQKKAGQVCFSLFHREYS
jgi:16S rRNA (guanine966-N2)-methyltransferase